MTFVGSSPESETRHSGNRVRLWAWTGAAVFVVVSLILTKTTSNRVMDTGFDNSFGLPNKPTHEEAPYLVANNIFATIAMTMVGLTGLVAGIIYFRRSRDVVPMMLAISAPFVVITEVFLDIMGGVYFPWSDTEPLGHAFTLMGRQMPVWIIAGWFGYAALSAIEYKVLASRPTTGKLWISLGVLVVAAIVFEEILLSLGIYHYYGNHPLVLGWELPWWWEACNPLGVMLAVALAYRFRDFFQGIRALLLIGILPVTMGAAYGFSALPGWIALNADYPWLVTQLLGFASLGLGFVNFCLILKLVLNRNPFDLGYAPPEDGAAEFVSQMRSEVPGPADG